MKWAWHVARLREKKGVCRVLVEELEGKRPPGIPRNRWENKIKKEIQEVGLGHVLD
jgi:hypothetical protein